MRKVRIIPEGLRPEAVSLMAQTQKGAARADELLEWKLKTLAVRGDQEQMPFSGWGGRYDCAVHEMIVDGKISLTEARTALGSETVKRIMAYDYTIPQLSVEEI